MAGLLIHSARRIAADTGGAPSDDEHGWVLIRHGFVVATGTGPDWAVAVSAGDETVDARAIAGPGAILTPGLVDIHNHGGGGHSYDESAEGIAVAVATHARHGVTRIALSLVSASVDTLVEQVDRIAAARQQIPGIVGVHLEGPFLDQAHKGAHNPTALIAPAPVALARLLASDMIRQITIAPELTGGIDAVRQISAAGIAPAIGHTAVDAETFQRAVDAGATLLTHTFNAMPPLHHRLVGPIGVAIDDSRVTLEIIADGHHVDPRLVAMLFRAAPGRVALVSDAMAAAASPDGAYTLGDIDVDVVDGVAHVQGTDIIAGSTLTLDRAVRNAVSYGIPLPAAVAAATLIPASAIGCETLGRLTPGSHGDAVIWTSGLIPVAVWRGGTLVSGATLR
ncbi:N-acetylglucosamine-6-phosphate deacetylase [Cryobacterium frigoriphilum]|uniref:N-acetylglucosamine-6-phosphate deacetylase n=1 Tax=Cryobacterium frigoriphilum TaxID=1259150 RepID=A0A4R8ZZW3_9MICO|nr:amidohydrolase family protein [Cryobacterium frigoriphilum]TFD49680.1 N-acetylglucosamine-6-phosphate deacetylase [Cryobacterium frigoriphilum]